MKQYFSGPEETSYDEAVFLEEQVKQVMMNQNWRGPNEQNQMKQI